MKKKQLQWDLLPDECVQLRERMYAKVGNTKLIEALQRTLAYQVEAEETWWESLRLRLGITREEFKGLIADFRLQKVWIKGGVEELDKITHGAIVDNPCL